MSNRTSSGGVLATLALMLGLSGCLPAPPLTNTALTATPTPAIPAPGRSGANRAVWATSSMGRIAYIWQGDLYTANLDGSDTLRLTEHGAAAWRFSWSPDGRVLLYGVISAGGDPNSPVQALVADWRGLGGTPFLGGQLIPITWSWSPDVKRLVFNAAGSWVVKLDGSGLRRLETPPGAFPSRVPGVGGWLDDERVFYSSGCGTGCGRVGILNVDTGESTPLGDIGPSDVSPDARNVVYAEAGPGNRIYLLDVESRERREIYNKGADH